MGRPLNKKYFGNRNIGSGSTTADDGIGGGALASISNGTVGAIQINDTYKTFPGLTVAAPTIPGGVTATSSVVWEVATVSLAGGTGYTAGTITSITGLDTFGSPDCRFTITVDGSGVPTFGAFTNRGEFTSIDGTGISTWAVVKDGDGAAQATITFRVKSITITEQGSGYVSTPQLTWSQVNGGTMPSAQTVTMLVDSTTVGTVGDQENAIRMTAYLTGGSAVDVDIIRQVSTNRYKVTDGTRTGIVSLTSTLADAAGEGSILATDSDGGTYYVTKLTAHKATVTRGTGTQFATNEAVQWTFDAATEGSTVQIANA
jgi:hypothetical protein